MKERCLFGNLSGKDGWQLIVKFLCSSPHRTLAAALTTNGRHRVTMANFLYRVSDYILYSMISRHIFVAAMQLARSLLFSLRVAGGCVCASCRVYPISLNGMAGVHRQKEGKNIPSGRATGATQRLKNLKCCCFPAPPPLLWLDRVFHGADDCWW